MLTYVCMTYERNTGDGFSRIAGVTDLESAIKVCEQYKLPLFNADVDSVKRGSIAGKSSSISREKKKPR